MFWFILVNTALGLGAGVAVSLWLWRTSAMSSVRREVALAHCVAASAARAGRAASAVVALRWHAREQPALAAVARELADSVGAAELTAAIGAVDARAAEFLRRHDSVGLDAAIGLTGEALEPFGVRLEAPALGGSRRLPDSAVAELAGVLRDVADRTRHVIVVDVGVGRQGDPRVTIDRAGLRRDRVLQWRRAGVYLHDRDARTLVVTVVRGRP